MVTVSFFSETIFFHSLRQQSFAASASSFFFSRNLSFSQSFIPASENEFLVYWKQYFKPTVFQVFFLLTENITEIWGKSSFKRTIFLLMDTIFFFFSIFSDKFKAEAYFSISFTWLVQTDFLPTEIVLFWFGQRFFCCY